MTKQDKAQIESNLKVFGVHFSLPVHLMERVNFVTKQAALWNRSA